MLDQELTEPPVPVEASADETEVVVERVERFAVSEQEFHCAHISVICAPLDQRYSALIGRVGGMALRDVIKDKVGAAIRDQIEHVFLVSSCSLYSAYGTLYLNENCNRMSLPLNSAGSGGNGTDALMPATAARSSASEPDGVAITSFGTCPTRSILN